MAAGHFLPALGHRLLNLGTAADGELQHLEVNLVKSRCIEQPVKERVHTADHGKVLFLAFFD